MNENDEYSHVQRRLCAVIAKSEWTSSRMRMQKSGEELRERRAKSHRTANQFLQELLEKHTDSDLIDDNGAVDRYHKFVRYKSTLHDDSSSTLDEFHRRLRDLNKNRRNQTTKLNDLQSTIEIQHNEKNIATQSKSIKIIPSTPSNPITSTPNDTSHEFTTSPFHADEIQDLSNVQSLNTSFIESQLNLIESSMPQRHSSLLEKLDILTLSTSSLNQPVTQTLCAPIARRPDGTEMTRSPSLSPENRLLTISSKPSTINYSYLPRSLTSREKVNSILSSKRQLPSVPNIQSSSPKQILHEQFDTDQLYDLLDNLDSQKNFTKRLDQLTASTIILNDDGDDDQLNNSLSIDRLPLINNNEHEEKSTLPNLFQQSLSSSSHEKHFYTRLTINMDDIRNILLYTMTLSTVQLSASLFLPYSILNGRRPLLKCSDQTCFQQIRSKQLRTTCQVTAIDSSMNLKQLQQNDIILKINDQSVWGLTTDAMKDILRQCHKRSNTCSLTIARLCQPFI